MNIGVDDDDDDDDHEEEVEGIQWIRIRNKIVRWTWHRRQRVKTKNRILLLCHNVPVMTIDVIQVVSS